MLPAIVQNTSPLFLIVSTLILLLFIPVALRPAQLLRWLQRKRYQYEVTFGLYMMTPTEKFILNSFIFLTFSMILIAVSLYLPEHILKITHRAFYYYSGTHPTPTLHSPSDAVYNSLSSSTQNSIIETFVRSKTAASIGIERAVEAAGGKAN